MDNEYWDKIGILFEEVLKLNDSERIEFLKSACESEEMILDVISLVEADSNIPELLQGNASEAVDLQRDINYEGKIIGAYRIINKIAEGGMGSVFLAERADGHFEQKVALKLIKPGLNSDHIIKRFREERQILARLHHPNISRLLDGGLTNDSLPYFTMEYVEGEQIDKYCDDNKLSLEERIKLFIKVCSAVQYAHQNLVIHRDLKPGNILITREGNVKLLDFGIAKVFSLEETGEENPLTRTGLFVMTPEYASPEQIRGETITTSTDIYNLGLILYKLLSGFLPYVINKITPLELEKIICLTSPEKPSTKFIKTFKDKEHRNKAEKIFKQRKTEPEKLHKKLSGDLDNICLLTLRKEPGERYSSAEQLKNDLEKYLKGLPVSAQKPTINYRTKKFVLRHKIAVTTALFFFMTLSFLITFYTIQLKEQRDKATLEAAKSTQVSQFLQDIFKVANPDETEGKNISARELLDRGAQKINSELSNQPVIKAKMLNVIGNVYGGLGIYEKAEPLLNEAVNISKKIYGKSNLETAVYINSLGELIKNKGLYDSAAVLYKEAIRIHKTNEDTGSFQYSEIINNLAIIYNEFGNYKEAEKLYRSALKIQSKEKGEESREVSTLMNNLALLLHETGNYNDAETIYRKALVIQRKKYGDINSETSTTLYNFSQLLRDKGKYKEAEPLMREALEIDRKLYGEEHPYVAYDLNNLAMLLQLQGDFKESENLFRRALNMRYKLLGEKHPDLAYSLSNYSSLLIDMGRYEEAEVLFDKALKINVGFYEKDHKSIGNILAYLGKIELLNQRYKSAEKYYKESLKMFKNIHSGNEHMSIGKGYLNLARLKYLEGKNDSAKILLKEAFDIFYKISGGKTSLAAASLELYGNIYSKENNFSEAEVNYKKAISVYSELHGKNHPLTAGCIISYGELLVKIGRYNEAESKILKGITVLENILPHGSWQIDNAQSILGECLAKNQKIKAAEKLLLSGYNNLLTGKGMNNELTISAARRLADFYEQSGAYKKADEYRLAVNKD